MRPTKVELDYMFVCSNCRATGWMTHKEASIYGHWICSSCGVVHKIEAPVKAIFKFKGDVIQKNDKPVLLKSPSIIPEAVPTNIPIDDFIATLVNLGYKKIEAKKIVLDKIQRGEYNNSAEDFMANLLRGTKCR